MMVATSEGSFRRPHLAVIAFAWALVGALAAGPVYAQSRTEKAPPPDVGSGRIAWFDITTSDLAGQCV